MKSKAIQPWVFCATYAVDAGAEILMRTLHVACARLQLQTMKSILSATSLVP
jgi:hypothetical protein